MKSKVLRRVLVFVLCAALLLPVCLNLLGGTEASAVTSLPYIESMKENLLANGDSLVILELVPDDGSASEASFTGVGSIGYYVSGQEPCAKWLDAVAALRGRDARASYANALFQSLSDKGILGSGNDAPLTANTAKDSDGNYYVECYPWQEHAGMTALKLKNPETVTVTGTFDKMPGSYRANWQYQIDAASAGTYNQVISSLVYGGDAAYYYVNPTFTALSAGHMENNGTPNDETDDYFVFDNVPVGTTVYVGITGSDAAGPIKQTAADYQANGTTNVQYCQVVGTMGQNLQLDGTLQYYTLSATGAPTTEKSGYAAVSTGFVLVGDTDGSGEIDGEEQAGVGYFSRQLTGYTHVEDGTGDYSFIEEEGGEESAQVAVSTVYYKGGYQNNNWFCRNVLDMESGFDQLKIIVNSVTPDKATEAMVAAADLIVLSGGGQGGGAYAAKDITQALSDTIYAAAVTNETLTPVITDLSLKGGASQMAVLAGKLYDDALTRTQDAQSDTDGTFVSENLLFFTPNSLYAAEVGGTTPQLQVKDLATPYFNNELVGTAAQGLTVVQEELQYENFLRKQQGLKNDLLPDAITMAKTVRYILNYQGHRVVTPKETIRVLDLEPAAGIQILDKATVQSWLPKENVVKNIEITTMSLYEFVGKIEDLNENYDLIYFGDSTEGLNAPDGEATYRDGDNMNGLLYTNVGDTVVTKAELGGMLNRDYNSDGTLKSGDQTTYTFRYSGNDLTQTKQKAIEAFARAGYPVILGSELVSHAAYTGQPMAYEAHLETSFVSGDQVTLRASVKDASGYGNTLAPNAYTWYSGTDGVTFEALAETGSTLTVDSTESGAYYYCQVSIEGATAPAKTEVLRISRESRVTVTQITEEGRDSGSYEVGTDNKTLSVSLSGYKTTTGQYETLRATVKLDNVDITNDAAYKDQISYVWERRRSNQTSWSKLDNENGATCLAAIRANYDNNNNNNKMYEYRCTVTLLGASARSESVRYQAEWVFSGRGGYDQYVPSINTTGSYTGTVLSKQAVSFDVDVDTISTSATGFTLKAEAVSNDASFDASKVKFYWSTQGYDEWYQNWWESPDYYGWNGTAAEFSGTFTSTTAVSYYCNAFYFYSDSDYYWNDDYSADCAHSYRISISRPGATSETKDAAVSGTYILNSQINTKRVDNSSYVYETLNTILPYNNVLSENQAQADPDTVLQYLNLSKPEIVFTDEKESSTDSSYSYPTEYERVNNVPTAMTAAADGHYYLKYSFSIANATDATPNTTTYDCRLYIDQDSSGLYTEDEEITDIVVRTAGGVLLSPNSAGRYSLKADTTYTVTRQMPTSYAGIIPWKLEIEKNMSDGSTDIHASRIGYTRIDGSKDKQTIKILQIASSGTTNGRGLADQMTPAAVNNTSSDCYSAVTKTTYKGIYGKLLADVTDFNISITTIKAGAVDGLLSGTATVDALYNYLTSNYSMIIIGYDDMYGELSNTAAQAIVKFIDSGKAVLFTHDTTSLSNVTESVKNQAVSSRRMAFSDPSWWGYYFNSVLRTPVGLDRYGIRSTQYGSTLAGQTSGTNLAGSSTVTGLLENDYSVAYLPNSARTQTVADVQGYSNYALHRYLSAGSTFATGLTSGDRVKGEVSQVNQGQITTYPYDVNTALFSEGTGTSDTMDVVLTHEQPYQINLNSEDTVVWYCLSSDYYLKNDVVNAYYIYSKGNVTYSGMGHDFLVQYDSYCGDSIDEQYQNEAKLFVNTMIAAYRTVSEAPSVSFTSDQKGTDALSYLFLTGDTAANILLENTAAFGTNTDSTLIHFKLSDPNLNRDKAICAELYYTTDKTASDVSGAIQLTGDDLPTIRISDTQQTASWDNLTGGLVYECYLPQKVLTAIADQNTDSVRLFLKIYTAIDGKAFDNTAMLEVRKLDLKNLK